MRYDDDEKMASCQKEIQRLRRVVWELEEERKRFKTIAYNAIVMWRQDAFYSYDNDADFKELVLAELDITEEEYKEIMED